MNTDSIKPWAPPTEARLVITTQKHKHDPEDYSLQLWTFAVSVPVPETGGREVVMMHTLTDKYLAEIFKGWLIPMLKTFVGEQNVTVVEREDTYGGL